MKYYSQKEKLITFSKQFLMLGVSVAIVAIYCYWVHIPDAFANSLFTIGFLFLFIGVFRYMRKDGFLDFSGKSRKARMQLNSLDELEEEQENTLTKLNKYEDKIIVEKAIVGIIAMALSLLFY